MDFHVARTLFFRFLATILRVSHLINDANLIFLVLNSSVDFFRNFGRNPHETFLVVPLTPKLKMRISRCERGLSTNP